jgi:PAS domain-containing protein
VLGYTEDEYIGQPIEKFHVDKSLIQNILTKLINHEDIWRQEAELICKDGSHIKVQITSSRGKKGLTRCLSIPMI